MEPEDGPNCKSTIYPNGERDLQTNGQQYSTFLQNSIVHYASIAMKHNQPINQQLPNFFKRKGCKLIFVSHSKSVAKLFSDEYRNFQFFSLLNCKSTIYHCSERDLQTNGQQYSTFLHDDIVYYASITMKHNQSPIIKNFPTFLKEEVAN